MAAGSVPLAFAVIAGASLLTDCSADETTPAPATSHGGAGGTGDAGPAGGTGGAGGAGGAGAAGGGVTIVTLGVKKAFPDLWGEGADNIRGGSAEGSVKFFVTSLDDTNTADPMGGGGSVPAYYVGTFRGAMNLTQVRHIIPRVSGNVVLSGAIDPAGEDNGSFTYHGHLAPHGGLYVTNNRLSLQFKDDIVLRFLRLRWGPEAPVDNNSHDALRILRASRVAVDHCSLAWGADETFSIGNGNQETFEDIIGQNNIIGQCRRGTKLESHNTGTLLGWTDQGEVGGIYSWHNNVYVGVSHRTPNFGGGSEMYGRLYNNVVYDWESRLTNVVGAPRIDVAYNYYKMGPANANLPLSNFNQFQPLRDRPYPPSLFSAGNVVPTMITDPQANNQFLWTFFKSPMLVPSEWFRDAPLPIDEGVGYHPLTAQQAYDRNIVAMEAGANRSTDGNGDPVIGHDEIDEHYLTSIAAGTDPRLAEEDWIHPLVPDSTPHVDDNWDGIADAFATAHGIVSADEVITHWDFGAYLVVNLAGYDAFEMYSAWVAGDFERLAQQAAAAR